MRTLINILLGTTICMFSIVAVHAQGSNGWSTAGPKNIAGRILAIHVDVKNDQRVYAGAAGGGFWISTNEGKSWSRSKFNGSAAVSAITQSEDGTIYIGTGEGFNMSDNKGRNEPGVITNNRPYGMKGDGVYKSTDYGLNFERLEGTEDWTEVNSIAYCNKPKKLYVVTDAGLKISSDYGRTFEDANGVPLQKGTCVRVGSDGTVIYSDFIIGDKGNVYVSTNGGSTFVSVCGTALPKLPNEKSCRISVDIAPTDPNVMYALVTGWDTVRYNISDTFAGVYVSKDKGQTWREIFPPGGVQDPMKGSWGYYCNTISVSPDTSTRILLGSFTLYSASEWSPIHYYIPVPIGGATFIHCIYYAKNNIAYVGTNTGIIYMSTSVEQRNNSLATSQAYTLGVGNDGRIMIGARDNGTILVEKPNGETKAGKRLTSIYPDGADCVFSMIKSDALFYTGSYGYCYRQASLNSDPQKPSQWMGGALADTNTAAGKYLYVNIINKEKNKEYTRWNYSSNSKYNECELSKSYANPYVSPLAIWESVNDDNSIDSVLFIADKTYAPGDTICVKSNRNGYPIWMKYTGTKTLERNKDTIKVKDIVTSRLFIGGSGYKISNNIQITGAPVFMATDALDFASPGVPFVCVFRTKDTTEQVMDLTVSKDGDHLFILTKKITGSNRDNYSIYRVSGFDTYRKPEQMEVSKKIQSDREPFSNNNNLRELSDHVLVENIQLNDILGIALDPQDNNTLVYVTNGFGDRIHAIKNALTATGKITTVESKEGTGIPSDVTVYCIIIEQSNSDVAYIGTGEGVYKTINFTSSSPEWKLYNKGIDMKVPVFKLYQQTNLLHDNSAVYYDPQGQPTYVHFPGVKNYGGIYAATHGLGVFMDSTHWNKIQDFPIPGGKSRNMSLHVFPNPVHASVTVDFTIANTNNVNITLSDVTGRTIYKKSLGYRMIGNYQENIDCSTLSEGIYSITVSAGYQNQSAKIVIRK